MSTRLYTLPPRGIRSMGSPASYASHSKPLQTSAALWPDCRDCTGLLCSFCDGCVCFTGHPCTVQEYKGRGSKVPTFVGFIPTDGVFVAPRRQYRVSNFLVRTCVDKV